MNTEKVVSTEEDLVDPTKIIIPPALTLANPVDSNGEEIMAPVEASSTDVSSTDDNSVDSVDSIDDSANQPLANNSVENTADKGIVSNNIVEDVENAQGDPTIQPLPSVSPWSVIDPLIGAIGGANSNSKPLSAAAELGSSAFSFSG